jgi:flagellar assembly protein FliH
MSSRARRTTGAVILPFSNASTAPSAVAPATAPAVAVPPATSSPVDASPHPPDLAAVERDAFAKGFAQGERAGAEAAARRGEAMLRRLTQSLEEVAALRAQVIHDTEHQMVQLALAIARRIVHREVTLDHDVLVAIARVAMDRLGDTTQLTVRLNPEDHAAVTASGAEQWTRGHVNVVADARLPRGGCRIESDLGLVDASIDAQLHEVAQVLLGESSEVTGVRER